jgi:hypothetical protein
MNTLDVFSTALYQRETFFEKHGITNQHVQQVITACSEQTGVSIDQILSETSERTILYVKHLVHYFLHDVLGFTPTQISYHLPIARSSVYNSVKNIRDWKGCLEHVKRDISHIEQDLRI